MRFAGSKPVGKTKGGRSRWSGVLLQTASPGQMSFVLSGSPFLRSKHCWVMRSVIPPDHQRTLNPIVLAVGPCHNLERCGVFPFYMCCGLHDLGGLHHPGPRVVPYVAP